MPKRRQSDRTRAVPYEVWAHIHGRDVLIGRARVRPGERPEWRDIDELIRRWADRERAKVRKERGGR